MSDITDLYKTVCPSCGAEGLVFLNSEDLDDRAIIVCSNCGKEI